MDDVTLKPFVKWVGGKRQLIKEIEKRLPSTYNNYYEPFVGGGAILFHLKPKKAFINDINKVLINSYKIIKENPNELIETLKQLDNQEITKEKYYELREKFIKKLLQEEFDIETASLFIFLNKRCFNGLLELILKVSSMFLLTISQNAILTTTANIINISEYLKNVELSNLDFEESLKNAKPGDFIFFDSPYAPLNPTSFESYTEGRFWEKRPH